MSHKRKSTKIPVTASSADDDPNPKEESNKARRVSKVDTLVVVDSVTAANTASAAAKRVESMNEDFYSHLLKDTDGTTCRGSFLELADRKVLVMLHQAYKEVEKTKLIRVGRFENLLYFPLEIPGFPVGCGRTFSSFDKGDDYDVPQLEKDISGKIKGELERMGYCSEKQDIQLYLSFMTSLWTEIQSPHIDYKWPDVEPSEFQKNKPPPRAFRNSNYKEWVPFIALFPVTTDGMTVEVWNARSRRDKDDKTGCLVHITYGKILLLRADVVHAGGFKTAASGNPRCHFYVYKTPGGVAHSTPLSNSYHIRQVQLSDYYKHCPILDLSLPPFTSPTPKIYR